jgi:phosphate transport system substrate-binding protein
MVHSKFSSAVSLTLYLGLTAAPQIPAQAQATAFQLPGSVPAGTNVRIDGSSSTIAVNQVLKQRFEQQYPGTQVTSAYANPPQGLQALIDGKVDLAAIGRPLTAAEKAKGLAAVPIGRDKIAIVVGSKNPFTKSLDISQFAKIFRGDIKNWSEVGGSPGAIRLVDRPDSSDTRQALKSYPAFRQAKFETGKTAEKLKDDSSNAVVQKLGANGIGYTTANQIKNQPGVRAVVMNGTSPTDPRYPFSQPLYYVYNAAKPTPAAQAFLGFATAPVGQSAIEQAGVAVPIVAAAKGATTKAETAPKQTAAKNDASAKDGAGTNKTTGTGNQVNPYSPPQISEGRGQMVPADGQGGVNWWWLFPIASGAGLLWLLAKGQRKTGAASRFGADDVQRSNSEEGFVSPDANYTDAYSYSNDRVDSLGEESTAVESDRRSTTDWAEETPQTGTAFTDPTPQLDNSFVGDEVDAASYPVESMQAAGETGRAANVSENLGSVAPIGGAAAGAWTASRSPDKIAAAKPTETRIALKARSPQEVEAYWEIAPEQMQSLRQQGGEKLALRLYDVTGIDLETQSPHSVQQFDCDEHTHRQRLAIATPARDYLAELGSLTRDGRWIAIVRSTHVHVPPSSTFRSNDAYSGSPAVSGSTTMASPAVNSSRSVLAGDRDSTVEQPDADTWTTREEQSQESSPFSEQVQASDSTKDANPAEGSALGGAAAGAAAAWSFLSGRGADRAPASTPNRQDVAADRSETHDDATDQISGLNSASSEGRIVLTPRNAHWAYAYWDVPRAQRSGVNRSAGETLALRLYDVTDADLERDTPQALQQFDIDALALSCDVPIPTSNRTYVVELGYIDGGDRWTRLARSTPAWVSAN